MLHPNLVCWFINQCSFNPIHKFDIFVPNPLKSHWSQKQKPILRAYLASMASVGHHRQIYSQKPQPLDGDHDFCSNLLELKWILGRFLQVGLEATWLVGGLEHQFYFPINIGLLIIPIDFHIFQRGGPTTNQMVICSSVADCQMVMNSEHQEANSRWLFLSHKWVIPWLLFQWCLSRIAIYIIYIYGKPKNTPFLMFFHLAQFSPAFLKLGRHQSE